MQGPHWTDLLTPAQWRHCRRFTPSLHGTPMFQPKTRLKERTTHQDWQLSECIGAAASRIRALHDGYASAAPYRYEEWPDWGDDAPPSERWSGPIARLDLHIPGFVLLPPLPDDYEPDPGELRSVDAHLKFDRFCIQLDAQKAAWKEATRRDELWWEAEQHQPLRLDDDGRWDDEDEPVP